jgi:recombinational DNA repair protein (RecF pathway)
MAIEKYTTPAIILESYDQGEHDKVFKVFTREFGLLFVHAKSIRKLESKLRGHMLPRSIATITIVKGKEVWRLVGGEAEHREYVYIHEVTKILSRFIKGEGAHKELYDRIIAFLSEAAPYEEKIAHVLLYYVVFIDLGYADVKVIGSKTMKEYKEWSMKDLFTHTILSYDALRKHVHLVLKDSQL